MLAGLLASLIPALPTLVDPSTGFTTYDVAAKAVRKAMDSVLDKAHDCLVPFLILILILIFKYEEKEGGGY